MPAGLTSLGVTAQNGHYRLRVQAIQFVGDNNQKISVASATDHRRQTRLVATRPRHVQRPPPVQPRTKPRLASRSTAEKRSWSASIPDRRGHNHRRTSRRRSIDNTELKAAGITVSANRPEHYGRLRREFPRQCREPDRRPQSRIRSSGDCRLGRRLMGIDKAAMVASAGASQTGLGLNNDVFCLRRAEERR